MQGNQNAVRFKFYIKVIKRRLDTPKKWKSNMDDKFENTLECRGKKDKDVQI